MLLVLMTGFALSQAFRTVAAIMAPPLQQAFGLGPSQLGLFAGVFHFAFGALQLVMGMAIDVWGPRRTVLGAFPLAIVGALVTASADSYAWLLVGQVLTGIGCAPAFLACTVFIARGFAPERFAAVSGTSLGLGSVGLLLTGTPLALVIEAWSWRAGFVALAAAAALAWLAILLLVRDPPAPAQEQRPDLLAALRGYGALFRLPHTLGIVGLAVFTYAAFISLRGLWLGPLLIDRHGYSLVQSGHVAVAVSVVGMLGPPLFGRLDPGAASRRHWILGCTLASAALFLGMVPGLGPAWDVAAALLMSLVSGYIVLQYADVKGAYPAHMTGRAMAVFTMAMFLGVALMQWTPGLAASAALSLAREPYAAVFGAIAAMLVLGALAFRFLPAPPAASPAAPETAQSPP
jgi:predicted MFS family arabinose efflux permease